ncbi:MAG: hypothetical protein D6785_15845 [Planctomycetota bacterium]|nr:MAG: hypothetical protein D6785_15845 [Planctomycetota bacterium]
MANEVLRGSTVLCSAQRKGIFYVLMGIPYKEFREAMVRKTREIIDSEGNNLDSSSKEKIASRMDEIIQNQKKQDTNMAGFSFDSSTNIVVQVKQNTRVNISNK